MVYIACKIPKDYFASFLVITGNARFRTVSSKNVYAGMLQITGSPGIKSIVSKEFIFLELLCKCFQGICCSCYFYLPSLTNMMNQNDIFWDGTKIMVPESELVKHIQNIEMILSLKGKVA